MRRIVSSAALLATVGLRVLIACSSEDPGSSSSGTVDTPDAAADDGGGGGGDGGADASGPVGTRIVRGSRLAPRFQESADGFSSFVGIADTARGNAACGPGLADDGVLRCVPTDALRVRLPLFADSGCTKPVAAVGTSCSTPTLLSVSDDACVEKLTHYAVGAAHTAASVYLKGEAGECTEMAADPGEKYYLLGDKQPASSFVKLTALLDDLGGGVGVSAHDGEDGSHFPTANTVIVARKESCESATASDEKMRCLPKITANVIGFVDSACKTRAAEHTQSCDPAEKATTATSPSSRRVYELGSSRGKQAYFGSDDDLACGSNDPTDLWEVGAEIPAATFPLLDESEKGGTRLVAKFPIANGTPLPAPAQFSDRTLDIDCIIARGTDGKQRCLPRAVAQEVFLDALCSKPGIIVGAGQKIGKYLSDITPSCDSLNTLRIAALTLQTPQPASIYVRVGGSCKDGPTIGADVYAVGDEVPPSTFVEVTDVVK